MRRFLQLVLQSWDLFSNSEFVIGCSTEILLDNSQEGSYEVQWLKKRCSDRCKRQNLILLRAMPLAKKYGDTL